MRWAAGRRQYACQYSPAERRIVNGQRTTDNGRARFGPLRQFTLANPSHPTRTTPTTPSRPASCTAICAGATPTPATPTSGRRRKERARVAARRASAGADAHTPP
ncbi:hypothetical protein SAV14893_087700 [Streptomyces avermitilis]|uniref:Uncharacterized protein n=1 Tax=Streptomyces avermitilis TaxID=33903 RepID=A0A4D4MD51_STRAX|nr:hypothetical protein SAVMC3_08870 [Streptomyces avermitilis]GDY69377.1 hypothetical protein SAV14893_087700 [Streptomyces avermitilis]GDY79627.1 hypothetical protein SAV31267_091120 [Streptomyces avermitilis]